MVFTYLLFSYLLSGIGFAFYHFLLRKKSNPVHRKYFVYAVLAISFILPAFLLPTTVSEPVVHIEHIDELPFVSAPTLDKELAACYDAVASEEGFCHCEKLQASNLLYFNPNPIYDNIMKAAQPLLWLTIAVIGILLLNLFIKLGYLLFLKSTKQYEVHEKEGLVYRLLKVESNFLAASFKLKHNYILWHPSLDSLSYEEQEAVLLHELSHLKNKDTWELIALSFIQMLWFINPVFYFIKREIELLNEYIADAFALRKTGNVHQYAHLLVKLKERQQLSLSAHFGGDALKSRILTILKPNDFIQLKFIPAISAVLFGIMLVIGLSIAPALNQQQIVFEEYKVMQHEHNSTGQKAFCRACLHEDLFQLK